MDGIFRFAQDIKKRSESKKTRKKAHLESETNRKFGFF